MKKLLIALVLGTMAVSSANWAFADEEEGGAGASETTTIPHGKWLAGGLVGTFVGFGVGNAIQGNYMPRGLIFTASEAIGYGLYIAGIGSCVATIVNSATTFTTTSASVSSGCNGGLEAAGLILALGFHVWEIIDVWTAPHEDAAARPRKSKKVSFWAVPQNVVARNGSTSESFVGGLSLRF